MEGSVVALRALEESDLSLVRRWNFDPDITRYFPSRWPVSVAEQKKWFDSQATAADKKRLIICDKATEQAIGMLGIMDLDHVNKHCEIGITVGDPAYWGQPHAREAMQLALKFLFVQFNMHIVYLRVLQVNERAVAFFEKCGFSQNGVLRDMIFVNGAYHSWVWMSITQTEFAARDL